MKERTKTLSNTISLFKPEYIHVKDCSQHLYVIDVVIQQNREHVLHVSRLLKSKYIENCLLYKVSTEKFLLYKQISIEKFLL